MNLTILPTHQCFDDAFEYILMKVKEGATRKELNDTITVVHAICTLPNGKLYAHAWIEDGNSCIFKGFIKEYNTAGFLFVEKQGYYEDMKVVESTRYRLSDIFNDKKMYNTTGPWEEKYKALCSTDKTDHYPGKTPVTVTAIDPATP